MEFLDQNGFPLEIGDEIEYWSPSYKDWLKAKVVTIEAIRRNHRVPDGAGGYKDEPLTVTKIKVGKWDPHSQVYKTWYDALNLRKSETIRKVF